MPKVLVADRIAQEGVEALKTRGDVQVDVRPGLPREELKAILGDYEALIVRSETQVTADLIEAGKKLVVIGRAGVGVDNIDLEAATRQGIAVVNAPTGNTLAAAEHSVALMLAMARHIARANASLREGKWDRSAYVGVELRGKTLGIIGLGRVGSEVARRAASFNMHILGYDPFLSPDFARNLGVELVSLDDLYRRSDFITVHTPMTDSTRGLIGAEEIAMMKKGVRLINVARGGIIGEQALLDDLNSSDGKVAGAAIDVFSEEPPRDEKLWTLAKHPKVVATPHLGASTAEAQVEVGREVANEVLLVLDGKPARSTVNLPFMPPDVQKVVAPYLETASVLGKLVQQLAEGQFVSLNLRYSGELAQYSTSVLRAAALVGVLSGVTEERLNLINAPVFAAQRGMKIEETKESAAGGYSSMITVEVRTQSGSFSLSGGRIQDETHILQVNDYVIDLVPSSPYLLFIDHRDRPGMIGALGTITGKHDINIAFMAVGRQAPRGRAMMVVGLDDPAPPAVLQEIRSIPHIVNARVAKT
ncbi:MAG: phosphoglycerate dehydrogenase [Chloroflexi bacterium]|nr:phosphoglycerate dehydrogenase [Chloroflexota bacterium]